MTTAEWQTVVTAFQGIKNNGVYDDFTRRHSQAMMAPALMPGETGTTRNAAHRGPVFLPWHRQALYDLEAAMQAIVPGVQIPYWRWDLDGSNWRNAKVWTYVGGNGSSSRGYNITTGPFKDWVSVISNSNGGFSSRAGIKRQFVTSGSMPGVVSLANPVYDVAPWSENNSTSSCFRRLLELAHNTVHNNIRGDFWTGTAPNDPLFWLHHSNVDRIWAMWEAQHGQVYAPASSGPPGHQLNDTMGFLATPGVRPADVLAPPAYA
jgi:tyrosinase